MYAVCVTSTGTLKEAKAWIKRPMHRSTGEQDTLDRQMYAVVIPFLGGRGNKPSHHSPRKGFVWSHT